VLVEHGAARYTTQDLLDAEHRLLDHAAQPTHHGIPAARLTGLLAAFEQRHHVSLDTGQRALVVGFAGDPRRLVVGIGPAGAGKTTAMRALAESWRTTGKRVVPLAPSAAAAEVLGTELGCRAENLHKFHHAHTSTDGRPSDDWFVLHPGDLVVVDEAGMAGTRLLDWITAYARERGALVRLLGDPAQLTSVDAGGALRLIARDAGAVELTDLHRFTDPAEATATIGIREGRPEALHYYLTHDRISSGTGDAMLEAAYDAWSTDTAAGRTSLLIAASTQHVTALNTRARLERIDAGQVAPEGVELHDGTTAGVGDLIVTRRNQRQLTNRRGDRFVKNGDTWTIDKRHRNGDLTVRNEHDDHIRLPNDYVSRHVELGYATTTTRARGRTVDTAHALVNDTTTREALYVSLTRGRQGTRLYVSDSAILDVNAERPPSPPVEAIDVLAATLAREAAELSATEVRRTNRPAVARTPRPPKLAQRHMTASSTRRFHRM
jgi:ATP-dependent exoDNAse (exonuclease V) alpha subunit